MNKAIIPTNKKDRLVELDVIRGIALFGILVVNINYFSTPALYADMFHMSESLTLPEKWLKWITIFFFEFKFVSLFSILFGVSFSLFLTRLKTRGISVNTLFKRRLYFLLIIGLIHLFFFWYGDILTIYALLGFLLLLFVDTKPKVLLKWIISLPLLPILMLTFGMIFRNNILSTFTVQIASIYEHAIYYYANGTVVDIFKQRLIDIAYIYQGYVLMIPVIFSMFLLGMYIWKSGYITQISTYKRELQKTRKYSGLTGMIFSFLAVWADEQIETITSPFYFIQYMSQVISGPVFAIFYMTSLLLLLQNKIWRQRLYYLQSVGRMALTNYLMQTFICLLIFYSFGLGLFGQLNLIASFSITILIFLVQIGYSHLWLHYHRMGPIEMIWRTFTYKQK
ncbi:DUF418 domain-containing protein [Gracilibacillus massiliensis]|uniref:DUF418 domain-containing protein n=1 Tax=Gracilibacillus massiliensis TaxID=1564956 RepID=UPI00071D5278|nr:DUF418 domain-containing protein [Gracilibacillus massiliensis]